LVRRNPADFSAYDVGPMPMRDAKGFVREHHYARTCPSSTKYALGLYENGQLVGTGIWGYGVRPKHTIKKMFPSLDTRDYLELNRLCLLGECGKNSESWFISRMIHWIRAEHPEIVLVFSWADGMRERPGIIYQASSFYYGGFIKSEFYVNQYGQVVHPRLLITRYGRRDREFYLSLGLVKVRGPQFRYCKFLCGPGFRKRLLRESPMDWNLDYPKKGDIVLEFPDGKPDNFDAMKLTFTKIIEEKPKEMHRWCKGESTPGNQPGSAGAVPARCTLATKGGVRYAS